MSRTDVVLLIVAAAYFTIGLVVGRLSKDWKRL